MDRRGITETSRQENHGLHHYRGMTLGQRRALRAERQRLYKLAHPEPRTQFGELLKRIWCSIFS